MHTRLYVHTLYSSTGVQVPGMRTIVQCTDSVHVQVERVAESRRVLVLHFQDLLSQHKSAQYTVAGTCTLQYLGYTQVVYAYVESSEIMYLADVIYRHTENS